MGFLKSFNHIIFNQQQNQGLGMAFQTPILRKALLRYKAFQACPKSTQQPKLIQD